MERRPAIVHILFEAGADSLLEAAVLLVTFGFLEKIISEEPISLLYGFCLLFTAAGFFVLGCLLRLWRQE
jgi:hypothetical protein